MILIILISIVTLILLVWFKTEAIVEYGELFHLGQFLKTKEFKQKKSMSEIPLTYPMFLQMSYDYFLIRLITCPICLSFWVSLFITIPFISLITLFPFICIISLMLYGITYKILGL